MTSRRNQPAAADPAARIKRLQKAIGDGPHSSSINTFDILINILKTLDDQPALRLAYTQRKQAA